jgi:predicted RNase H-like HicB family nuclease
MKYKVVLKKSKEGFSVSCPSLPGCWSQGKTGKEAVENIQAAIREYLEALDKITKRTACGKWKSRSEPCPNFPASTIFAPCEHWRRPAFESYTRESISS